MSKTDVNVYDKIFIKYILQLLKLQYKFLFIAFKYLEILENYF
jgi:hypothetical protein